MIKHLYEVGVTTNSESGVSDITAFYDTFAAMEKHGIGKYSQLRILYGQTSCLYSQF
jgi:hypothetical protein